MWVTQSYLSSQGEPYPEVIRNYEQRFIDVSNCELKNRLLESNEEDAACLSFETFRGGVCKVFLSPNIRMSKRLRLKIYMYNTTDHRDYMGSHYVLF